MNVLGIWDGHDSGAALLVNGRLVAAVNEERLTRRKLEIRFPERSIASCLNLAGLQPRDVQRVAVSTSDVAKTLSRWAPSTKEAYYRIRRRKAELRPFDRLKKRTKYWLTEWRPNFASRRLSAMALRQELERRGLGHAELRLCDHHEAHAAAAAAGAGWDSCLVLTVDGVGDGLSATVSRFRDGRLERLAATPARWSPGILFEHATNLLNMRELEDEGKLMALADHTFPVPDAENPVMGLLKVQGLEFRTAVPGHSLRAPLARILWRYPIEQFAYMVQRTVEERLVEWARNAVAATGLSRIAISGGVASNVKATRRIRLLPEVEDVFVFPHMGDGGLALGAAVAAARGDGTLPPLDLSSLQLGPEFSEEEIVRALDEAGLAYERPADLTGEVADILANDGIVLWFQGRMEYGPRALGGRSVLARPDRPALRDRLNLVLKRRSWFQPFCPSMLECDARLFLEDYKGCPNRHMTMAYSVAPEYRSKLAGVISVDGSCRPQIVADDADGPYPDLLRRVREKMGLSVLLNTSFNLHGEPLVCSPAEAVSVFLEGGASAMSTGQFVTPIAGRRAVTQ